MRRKDCPDPPYRGSVSERMGEEGTVTLRILVSAEGKAQRVEIEKSSGYRRLDEMARNSAAACSFEPATINGKPQQALGILPYQFRPE